ncbi:DUF5615 family PIN-like protein [Synechocystis sp. PCC 7339]|uniref:DUF5615 family PIN-like protein n=1 Tax=unclassified Synechocystis TaxID=2640012 RepID=UPI001BAF2EC2|nr:MULTISPECIES: DUF5615 family PIN-like protein [unclassified Synechocystis]QUS59234.1 DUF5615 family PIN-like protein [Synechocystis sp. PCC 7338]UAJ71422.1 DUF5615 family PIN-like protein [Synechocystis sp. PCC 7339]
MKGFLFDENLPAKLQLRSSFPIIHVSVLGESLRDTEIWQYAKENDLVIITKDADFSDRIIIDSFPPKVIHLRFGNMRKKEFKEFLSQIWLEIEKLAVDHKLINVYRDRIESFR